MTHLEYTYKYIKIFNFFTGNVILIQKEIIKSEGLWWFPNLKEKQTLTSKSTKINLYIQKTLKYVGSSTQI